MQGPSVGAALRPAQRAQPARLQPLARLALHLPSASRGGPEGRPALRTREPATWTVLRRYSSSHRTGALWMRTCAAVTECSSFGDCGVLDRIRTCLAAVFLSCLNGTRTLRVRTTGLGNFGHRNLSFEFCWDRASMQCGGVGLEEQA